jgi:uncharacterized protein
MPDSMDDPGSVAGSLWLADWRRRVADLYAHVRSLATSDPEAAWTAWRTERERLFRSHPQSPLPPGERPAFRARHWPYDNRLRFEVPVLDGDARVPGATAATTIGPFPPGSWAMGAPGRSAIVALPNSGQAVLAFQRVGRVELPLQDGTGALSLYWMAGYAGGLFLPFRDRTSGSATYAAGRYLLDTAKGADLGGDPAAGTLIVDLNFAYHPSCAFDPRWACPLAPPENRLTQAIEAGERLA